ncbi:MAG: homocysteine S-methyltransferase family protein [Actinomycetia bacterium]|nr:homocysteine S-methyltransferase family protein [Actinomycetes bacterium]
MPDIMKRLGRDMLVIEGAMGTMLQSAGVAVEGIAPEVANLVEPDTVRNIHRYYTYAGADCAISNTFGASAPQLAKYGLADSLEAINQAGMKLARAGGAQHILADMGPTGLMMAPLGDASFDDIYEAFSQQATALAAEDPDAFLLETFNDIVEQRIALLACKETFPEIPVIASITCTDEGRMELSGTDPATAAIILEAAGADAVGLNCGLGPDQMVPLIDQMVAATTLPVIVQPNAGIPSLDEEGSTVFPGTSEEMGVFTQIAYFKGVAAVGSCCGSTPDFTGAIADELNNKEIFPVAGRGFAHPVLAGPRRHVVIGQGEVKLIGERINPTGKVELTDELLAGTYDTALRYANEQERDGADLLDINVGGPGVDQLVMLPEVTFAVAAVSNLPLVLDTSDPDALEAALRIYPGRALINSVNGDPQNYGRVFELANRYGACLIALALDERGISNTALGRITVIEKLIEHAKLAGIGRERLVVDSLVLAEAADPDAPQLTLKTLKAVKRLGLATVLGISNVSFGLPDRAAVNVRFFEEAKAAGLDAAIINPSEIGQKRLESTTASSAPVDLAELSMDELAAKFKSGEIFLPQLMATIETLKAQRLEKVVDEDEEESAPTIIFATVKGDIHSIGKDICVSLLQSQGFNVLDMGVDVDIDRIVDLAKAKHPLAVCLSALMTTTLPNMKATIEALHEAMPDLPVCVGGAVVTHAWASGADANYSSDAPECVTLVQSLEDKGE